MTALKDAESKLFEIEEFPGRLEKISVVETDEKKDMKAEFMFEDAEYKIKVIVQPKYEDLHDGFFVRLPYRISLKPVNAQLCQYHEVEEKEE